jgi:hypothetical protein
MNRMSKAVWPGAVAVVLAAAVTGCGGNDEMPRTADSTSTADESPTGLDGCITAADAKLMRFPGSRGEISAAVFGDGEVGVVVSNTLIGRVCDWLPWAEELAALDYRVMLFNYSSPMPVRDIPAAVETYTADTVEAAVKLRELGVQKLMLIGGSAGALSVLGAGLDVRIGADGVVSLSAAGSSEVTESVGRLELPVLFVAARDDFPAFQMANELYLAAENAARRELVILDGALHADMLLQPDAPTKPQVEQEILAFLQAL